MILKLKCSTIQDKLSAYLDNELDSRWQEEVGDHLATCPTCQRELEALRQTMRTMQTWEAPAVSPQVSAAFQEKLLERTARRSVWSRLFDGTPQRAAWAAGLAVALVAVLVTHPPEREPRMNRRRVAALPPVAPKSGPEVPGDERTTGSITGYRRPSNTPPGKTKFATTPFRPRVALPAKAPGRFEKPEIAHSTLPLEDRLPPAPVSSRDEEVTTGTALVLSKGGVDRDRAKGDSPARASNAVPEVALDPTSAAVACLTETPPSPSDDAQRGVASSARTESPELLLIAMWTETE